MNKATRSLIILIVLIVVVLGGGYFLLNRLNVLPGSIVKDSGSNVSDYSAVFLTNGQVYFGKINSLNSEEVDIINIYYLQVNTNSNLQSGSKDTSTDNQISLVKLGNELHGPNDKMRINRNQVLFTESLKTDSKVVKAINDYVNK